MRPGATPGVWPGDGGGRGGLLHVFVRATDGDLVEYVDDGGGGRHWNAHDHSLDAGGADAVR